jgi:hypothetical protein
MMATFVRLEEPILASRVCCWVRQMRYAMRPGKEYQIRHRPGQCVAQTRTCADSIQSESAGEERVGDSLLMVVEDNVRPDER